MESLIQDKENEIYMLIIDCEASRRRNEIKSKHPRITYADLYQLAQVAWSYFNNFDLLKIYNNQFEDVAPMDALNSYLGLLMKLTMKKSITMDRIIKKLTFAQMKTQEMRKRMPESGAS